MKKILPIVIVGIFVLSAIGAGALNSANESVIIENNKTKSGERATHTVFGEDGTATWCGFCKYAHGALKELYAEGQLDFYYVTLVSDKNSKAYARAKNDYNLYGYPTLWWDGGYKVNVGSGSIPGAKTAYTSSINQAAARAVEDVDIDLSVTWLGGTEMQVDCTVTNNEASTYGGTIRVYITEHESSNGWYDTAGQLYTFPFLDWAFNEPLSIPSGGSWSDTMTWDGASQGYPSVTKENTMVIAVVFNDEVHQGYSYPPSNNPFNAYYVDECVAAEASGSDNKPPEKPNIDGPSRVIPEIEYEFTFITNDPNYDNVWYYIQWGDGQSEEWIGPYPSGQEVTLSHTWSEKGIHLIKAKAKDTQGEESRWKTKIINIPRNRNTHNTLLHLQENFPNLYSILRQLFRL